MMRAAARIACGALLAMFALLPAGASAGSEAPSPSRLLVTAREFGFSLSKPKVDAGPAIIQLYNYGEDPHDLALQRAGGPTMRELGEVLPGNTGTLETRLRRKSTYKLWCTIAGHAELGMTASLKVAKKRPPRSR